MCRSSRRELQQQSYAIDIWVRRCYNARVAHFSPSRGMRRTIAARCAAHFIL